MASGGIHEVTVVLRTAGVGSSIGGIMKFAGALYILDKAVLSNIQAALDYEVVLKRMQAITGSSAESISSMSDSIRQMSATSIFSLNEVGRAQLEAVKMGYNITASYEVMNAAVDLAVAGEASLNDATMLVGRTLMQYNMHISEAGRVSDVFAMAANLSAADVEDFGKGMQYAGNVAKLFGYEVEDVAGWMAVLSNTGLEASMAGRSIRMFLTRLIKPTASASAEMKRFGIEVRDASGHLKKPPELINEVQRKLSGLTEAQRDETLAIISGIRGVNAYAGAIAQGTDELERFTKILLESDGAAEKLSSEMQTSVLYGLKEVANSYVAVTNAAIEWWGVIDAINAVTKIQIGYFEKLRELYHEVYPTESPVDEWKSVKDATPNLFDGASIWNESSWEKDKRGWEKELTDKQDALKLQLGDQEMGLANLQRIYSEQRLWMMQHGDELNPDWVQLTNELDDYRRASNIQTFEGMKLTHALQYDDTLSKREREDIEERLDEIAEAASLRAIDVFETKLVLEDTPEKSQSVLDMEDDIVNTAIALAKENLKIDTTNRLLQNILNRMNAGYTLEPTPSYDINPWGSSTWDLGPENQRQSGGIGVMPGNMMNLDPNSNSGGTLIITLKDDAGEIFTGKVADTARKQEMVS